MPFAPKEKFYENFIYSLTEQYERNKSTSPVYPSREEYDKGIRNKLRKENPDKVIEGLEKINGKTVDVWYFYP